jgi:hypothetical protein
MLDLRGRMKLVTVDGERVNNPPDTKLLTHSVNVELRTLMEQDFPVYRLLQAL